jgi:hypothetical protein
MLYRAITDVNQLDGQFGGMYRGSDQKFLLAQMTGAHISLVFRKMWDSTALFF